MYQGGAQLWAQRPASVSVGTPLPGSIVVYDDEVFWWGMAGLTSVNSVWWEITRKAVECIEGWIEWELTFAKVATPIRQTAPLDSL